MAKSEASTLPECTTRSTLREFLAALDQSQGRIPLDELAERLRQVELTFEELRRFAHFNAQRYQRNLVHTGPAYQALLLCWLPGQRSPIHDHTGSSCGVRVLRGVATETVFDRTPRGQIYATHSRQMRTGDIAATQDADIHQMSNLEDADLVTLHIYSPPLLNMNVYSLTEAEVRSFYDPIYGCVDGDGI